MRTVLISAVTAVIVVAVAFAIDELAGDEDEIAIAPAAAPAPATPRPFVLTVTEPLGQDAWVDASRTAGADHKPLADASSSICYLTKIEISGIRGPDDANTCRIGIDDFTGYWEVWAEVAEGGQSEVRCNARCLVWEEDQE